jgi:hypothetical protein
VCTFCHFTGRGDREHAGYKLDLVAEATFEPDTFTFHTAEKEAVLQAFLAPSERTTERPSTGRPRMPTLLCAS